MNIKGGLRNIIFDILPLKWYLCLLYRYQHGKSLNLGNPKRFSEKLFWLNIYYGQEEKETIQRCYDKYEARKYIEEKVGKGYLPVLYGIYDSADEIEFDNLPDKYVIKITQSCGYNIINNGKLGKTPEEIRAILDKWLLEVNDLNECKRKYKESSYYYTGKARIICEEYLEDSSGKIVTDNAFFCFNGTPYYYDIVYDSVDLGSGEKCDALFPRNIYTINKKYVPMELGRPTDESLGNIEFKNYETMIDLASKLSKDFPFIRVDLYNIDGRIVVGELTWIPMGGGGRVTPEMYDYEWGRLITLPDIDLDYKNYKRKVLI